MKPLEIKHRVIGRGEPLICVPVVEPVSYTHLHTRFWRGVFLSNHAGREVLLCNQGCWSGHQAVSATEFIEVLLIFRVCG